MPEFGTGVKEAALCGLLSPVYGLAILIANREAMFFLRVPDRKDPGTGISLPGWWIIGEMKFLSGEMGGVQRRPMGKE